MQNQGYQGQNQNSNLSQLGSINLINQQQMNQQYQMQLAQQQQYGNMNDYDIQNNQSEVYQRQQQGNMYGNMNQQQSLPSLRSPQNTTKRTNSINNKSKISYRSRMDPNDQTYRGQIFGLGMSNQHSSSSLQHSVHSYSLIQDRRWKFKPYQGYDPMNWQPDSIFKNKSDVQRITQRNGIGMVHGHDQTKKNRVDFTYPYKYNPGPGQYDRPLLNDKISQKIQKKRIKSLQERRQQLGLPVYGEYA